MKKVYFIISGTSYSGAEIVLNRYLDNNFNVDPYFIFIFKNKSILDKYKREYGKEKVFCLNIKFNRHMLRIAMPYYCYLISNKLSSFLQDKKYDLIYVNNTTEGVLTCKFIYKTKIKSILHIHDMRECYTHPYNNYLIEKYFQCYSKIVTVSNATKKSWEIENIQVVYNGLNNSFFKENINKECIKKAAFVGSLNNRKGADILIKSLPQLLDNTELEFYFVFRDFSKELRNKLYKYKSSKKVFIFENINEEQMKRLYDEIDLLIVPSRFDPLPTVIMEAQARGVIVLGNRTSGIPEMIPINELVVEMRNCDELIQAINHVIQKDELILNTYRKQSYEYNKKFSDENKKIMIDTIIKEM